MRKKYIWVFSLLLFVANLTLAACQTDQPSPTIASTPAEVVTTEASTLSSPLSSPIVPTTPPEPTPTAPAPAEGQAAIYGTLIVNDGRNTPLIETPLYLTPGIGENKDELPPLLVGVQEGDIRGFTDKQGHFAINNIPPGTYYLIIWAPLSWIPYHKVVGPEQMELILITLEADQTLALGEQIINWP